MAKIIHDTTDAWQQAVGDQRKELAAEMATCLACKRFMTTEKRAYPSPSLHLAAHKGRIK
jgi:hypothetical protein